MNFSLKPNPLIALWVPGFLTMIAILLAAYIGGSLGVLNSITGLPLYAVGFVVIVVGFAVGELLDTLRDVLWENFLDHLCNEKYKIEWDFFFDGEERHIRNLEEWYYTYYELDFNLLAGEIIVYLLSWFSVIHISPAVQFVMVVPAALFLISALLVRGEIKKLIDEHYVPKK